MYEQNDTNRSEPATVDMSELEGLQAQELEQEALYVATSAEFVYQYYEAEQSVSASFELDTIPPESVSDYLGSALDRSPWREAPHPETHFDLTADIQNHGIVLKDGIHLQLEPHTPWTLLHELAHWIDPDPGHGPRWAYMFSALVESTIGVDAAEAVRREYRSRNLPFHP